MKFTEKLHLFGHFETYKNKFSLFLHTLLELSFGIISQTHKLQIYRVFLFTSRTGKST